MTVAASRSRSVSGSSDTSASSTSSTSTRAEEEVEEVDDFGEGDEGTVSPRPFELLNFTPDSLKFVGRKVSPRGRDRFIRIGRQFNLSFKMVRSDTRLIKTILHSYGFTQCSSRNPTFNLLWTSAHLRPTHLRVLRPWQRVNHFPRSGELTRKDRLYENIARSKALLGGSFGFIPEFYVTPRDIDRLSRAIDDRRSRPFAAPATSAAATFIVKPVSGSRGRGIFFTNKADDIPLASPLLVSRYIANPLLVNGHKFDLRIYVAVTSFYPLIVYVYKEGLTRLASEKYSTASRPGEAPRPGKEDSPDDYVHLTNYSVNKNSKNFIRNETMHSEDYGHKWTLGALVRHLEKKGVDAKMLMVRIEDVIIKSLMSVQSTVSAACRSYLPHHSVCFELFGFDILVDDQLKPWLLEVNLSPSLTCDAPLDSVVKTALICDLFNLACVQLVSKKAAELAAEEKSKGEGAVESPPSSSGLGASASSSATSSTSSSSAPSQAARLKRALLAKPRTMHPKMRRMAAGGESKKGGESVRKWTRKVNQEAPRAGDWLRVFPRAHTHALYGPLMENVGSERWDARLHADLFLSKEDKKVFDDRTDAEIEAERDRAVRAHIEIMDTKRYPSLDSLSPDVRGLLEEAYGSAAGYAEKMTQEGEVYPACLPSVRSSARQRTRSCAEWYELRSATRADDVRDLVVSRQVHVADGKENSLPPLAPSPSTSSPISLAPPIGTDESMHDAVQRMTSV